MKILSTDQLKKLAQPHTYKYFIRIVLPKNTLYLVSSDEDHPRHGKTYVGGKIKKMPALKQTATPNAHTIKLDIEAVSLNLPALLLGQRVNQQRVYFELVYFDQNNIECYAETDQFTIDAFTASDSKGIWSTLTLSNNWAAFEKTAGRVTNNASQAAHFPEDTESYDDSIRVLNWGREGTPTQVVGQGSAVIYEETLA